MIASACDRSLGSEFVISGRENLPPTPDELANNQASSWLDWRLDEQPLEMVGRSDTLKPSSTANQPETIVEATGWVKNENGVVKLVAPGSEQIKSLTVGRGCSQ